MDDITPDLIAEYNTWRLLHAKTLVDEENTWFSIRYIDHQFSNFIIRDISFNCQWTHLAEVRNTTHVTAPYSGRGLAVVFESGTDCSQ